MQFALYNDAQLKFLASPALAKAAKLQLGDEDDNQSDEELVEDAKKKLLRELKRAIQGHRRH